MLVVGLDWTLPDVGGSGHNDDIGDNDIRSRYPSLLQVFLLDKAGDSLVCRGIRSAGRRVCYGTRTSKHPKVRKSWTFDDTMDFTPLQKYVAASCVSNSRLRPSLCSFTQERNRDTLSLVGNACDTSLPFHQRSALAAAFSIERGLENRLGSVTMCRNSAMTCGARTSVSPVERNLSSMLLAGPCPGCSESRIGNCSWPRVSRETLRALK